MQVPYTPECSSAPDEFVPTGKELNKVGLAIISFIKNKAFLAALFKEERAQDIMYRYLSGETLESIGKSYSLTRERIRQLCAKYNRKLIHHLTYYTKDVTEYPIVRGAVPVASTKEHRPWTDEDITKVVTMRQARKSFKMIAYEMYRTEEDVKRKYKEKIENLKAGMVLAAVYSSSEPDTTTTVQEPLTRLNTSTEWSEDELNQISTLRAQGASIKDIATRVNRRNRDVSHKLEELGLKKHFRALEDITKDDIEKAILQFKEGLAIADIADGLQLSQVNVARLLSEESLIPEIECNAGKPWTSEEQELLLTYIERDYPQGDIAFRLGRNHREITSKIYEIIKSHRESS